MQWLKIWRRASARIVGKIGELNCIHQIFEKDIFAIQNDFIHLKQIDLLIYVRFAENFVFLKFVVSFYTLNVYI